MSHLSRKCGCAVEAEDFWNIGTRGCGMPPPESYYVSKAMSKAMVRELRKASPIRKLTQKYKTVEEME